MKNILAGLALSLLGLSATSYALDEVNDPNAILKFPVYNNQGRLIRRKNVRAKKVWPQLDNWTRNVTDLYDDVRGGPKVKTREVWDSNLRNNIEDLQVPQDIEQWQDLKTQKKKADSWRPNRTIEPQKLATSFNRTFGKNDTFGIFQNGNFNSEGKTEKVKIDQTYTGGGVVFGKRFTMLSQTTRSNSESKTTRTDVKVLDTNVFVSKDGSVNASKSFTRSKSISKVFVLGILPVRVSGKISGSMGAKLKYKAEGLSIDGQVAPFVNTRATASAGIDLLLVVAGIEGSLNFFKNTLTANFKAAVDPFAAQLETALKVSNNLNLLSGKISVFAKVRRLFRRDKKFTKTIFSFNGINQNTTLIDERLTAEL